MKKSYLWQYDRLNTLFLDHKGRWTMNPKQTETTEAEKKELANNLNHDYRKQPKCNCCLGEATCQKQRRPRFLGKVVEK